MYIKGLKARSCGGTHSTELHHHDCIIPVA